MADQVRRLFRGIPRVMRSHWLGHAMREGSRTTDHYESGDPLDLREAGLAVDGTIALVAEHARRPPVCY